ncbi:hypothetical protein J7K55_03725 [Candidatus Aerophobetes bacterium]|nr:hypothetical protein [Candidatus Aerophobetes bacterium]
MLESTLDKKQQALEFSHTEAKEKIANMVWYPKANNQEDTESITAVKFRFDQSIKSSCCGAK